MAGVRILYVDDDAGLAVLMRRALAPRGYEVDHVLNGEDALTRLAEGRYHVVALDHILEDESGLEVLARIRALPDAPPVIYVTGSDDVRVAVTALKSGAIDYVWKDVQGHYRDLLAASIASALEQEALRQEKERQDKEIRAAKERAELLLTEVNHRVANSLSIVMALARMQASATPHPAAKDALHEVQARVAAIAGIHRRLYTSSDVRVVEMDTYLGSLVDELNSSLIEAERKHPIRYTGVTELSLPTDMAVSVGIAMTELVTNARKYAYPHPANGDIRVRLERVGEGRARLSVEDDGVGMLDRSTAQGTGVGSRIVTAMADTLRTTLQYQDGTPGTYAVLEFAVAT